MVVRSSTLCDLCRQEEPSHPGTLSLRGRTLAVDVCEACEGDVLAVAGPGRRRRTVADRIDDDLRAQAQEGP